MPIADVAQAQAVVRLAFEGKGSGEVGQAMDLLLKNARYNVDSPLLAMRVFGCVTHLPLSFHVLGRAGFPGHLSAEQGVALLDVLRQRGADPTTTVTLDGLAYGPGEFLTEYAQRLGQPVPETVVAWMNVHWAPPKPPKPVV